MSLRQNKQLLHQPSSPHRGEIRSEFPAQDLAEQPRLFRPNYVSFAGTYQCNLSCPHCCVPIEWADRLEISTAIQFLEDAHREGITTLGFTGGEPFLYPEFLVAVSGRAAELGFRFDKLMSNGVWQRDQAHAEEIFSQLKQAGFRGKLGLSVDKFHGIKISKILEFCNAARKVFDQDNIIALNYASRSPHKGLEPIQKLAEALDGVLEWSELLHRYLLVSDDFTMTLNWNHLAEVERAEHLGGGHEWDGTWFTEDYCEGPGQALIVNPRGEVKPCCGFASDLDQLTIGNVYTDTVAEIIERARQHPYVGKIFREGLSAIRDDILKEHPEAFPEATSNHCFFCWYVLTKNLVEIPHKAPVVQSRLDTASSRRISLNLASPRQQTIETPLHAWISNFLLYYDGKTVFLREAQLENLRPERNRTYLLNVSGPARIDPPPEQQPWNDYQAWLDDLRSRGYQLTTHNFSQCQQACGSH